MTTLLIAEDQVMLREALAALLDLEPDLSVVGRVGRGDEVLAAVAQTSPEVVLLDIELPGASGLDVAEQLRAAAPGTVVVVVTTFGRPGYLRRALEAGVRGFVVKDGPVEGLADAVRRVAAGELVIDPVLAADALAAGPNPLTAREQDVLRAGEGGATVADIAGTLHLSEQTVRNYLSAAIGKTGTRNRVEAAAEARDRGWL
ncbi:response regulator transcription factor [Phycicoccus sp.]|uniref:response regulator transcription factor n=1 Tax=Phycicoccus sp. TaxID=1902410 RepID=UPI002B649D75|nr:response regulator transcription factor [Phycicoccus sp.]HMM97335.1 response regulator transcription factor [Phycicoccus sp.]